MTLDLMMTSVQVLIKITDLYLSIMGFLNTLIIMATSDMKDQIQGMSQDRNSLVIKTHIVDLHMNMRGMTEDQLMKLLHTDQIVQASHIKDRQVNSQMNLLMFTAIILKIINSLEIIEQMKVINSSLFSVIPILILRSIVLKDSLIKITDLKIIVETIKIIDLNNQHIMNEVTMKHQDMSRVVMMILVFMNTRDQEKLTTDLPLVIKNLNSIEEMTDNNIQRPSSMKESQHIMILESERHLVMTDQNIIMKNQDDMMIIEILLNSQNKC